MKKATWVFGVIYVAIGVMALLVFIKNINLRKINQEFAERNDELNREIGEYQAMEDFYWDFTDLLDEIYDGKIKEAVLIERVYWLKQIAELQEGINKTEYYELYIRQIQDDMDALLTITIRYYETTNREVTLEEYIATNYPELYERLLEY